MFKQLKNLGIVVIGSVILFVAGCSSTEDMSNGSSDMTREQEINAMLTEVVGSLGSKIDFGEGYINKYMDEMTEAEYVVMMTEEINNIIKEDLQVEENNPLRVEESEINDDSLNLLIETEILNDMQHLDNKKIQSDIDNVHKETIEEFKVDEDEGLSLYDAQQKLEDYVAEYYPKGCYVEESGDNGEFRYNDVYDSEGNYVETIELEYATEEIRLSDRQQPTE